MIPKNEGKIKKKKKLYKMGNAACVGDKFIINFTFVII